MIGGPFREQARLMLCPRCGEILEHAFDAVRTCLRCEGLWIGTTSLEKAFGDRHWPESVSTWWRSALPCPACALEGETRLLGAAMVGAVLVDRCFQHGVWLDRGELARVWGGVTLADTNANDTYFDLLRERLKGVDGALEELRQRRDAFRAEAELRQRSAEEHKAWLAAEQERRLAAQRALDEERRRRDAEAPPSPEERLREEHRRAHAARRAELLREDEAKRAAEEARRTDEERAAQRRREEQQRQAERLRNAQRLEREEQRQRLGDTVANASGRVARLGETIAQLRRELTDREAELVRERARLRDAEVELAKLEHGP